MKPSIGPIYTAVGESAAELRSFLPHVRDSGEWELSGFIYTASTSAYVLRATFQHPTAPSIDVEIAVFEERYQFSVTYALGDNGRSVVNVSHENPDVVRDELRETLCDYMTVV